MFALRPLAFKRLFHTYDLQSRREKAILRSVASCRHDMSASSSFAALPLAKTGTDDVWLAPVRDSGEFDQ